MRPPLRNRFRPSQFKACEDRGLNREREQIMRMGKTGRVLAMTAGALALWMIDLQPVAAGSSDLDVKAGVETASADEMSARRRYYRRGGNAAAVRTFGAIAGTIGGIIAAEQARRYYRRHYWASPYAQPYAPYGYYAPYGGYAPYSYYAPY
jgi:hypothetical protein